MINVNSNRIINIFLVVITAIVIGMIIISGIQRTNDIIVLIALLINLVVLIIRFVRENYQVKCREKAGTVEKDK